MCNQSIPAHVVLWPDCLGHSIPRRETGQSMLLIVIDVLHCWDYMFMYVNACGKSMCGHVRREVFVSNFGITLCRTCLQACSGGALYIMFENHVRS